MDEQIRIQVFNWIAERSLLNDEVFTRNELESGINYKGQKITLVGPKGIWKPKSMTLPISITSSNGSQYEDSMSKEGLLIYKYRGVDPNHADNRGLRELMHKQIPIVYFLKITKGEYIATWPVFIQADFPSKLEFSVALEDKKYLGLNIAEDPSSKYARRSYLTSQVKIRLHQKTFREKVIRAYATRCTLCSLKHKELLDAAHIIPDSHVQGKPIVQNGLSLCKIHHAAFDSNIIGISPDYTIHVRTDILHEIDGPMLKHGIQEMNKQKLILPKNIHDWPDKERLDYRFSSFKNAV